MSGGPVDPATVVGAVLGGTASTPVRLSGGSSRVTSALDLTRPDGTVVPLILQQERGSLAGGGRVPVEAALLEAAAAAGVPVPRVVAAGVRDGLDPGWLLVERLEGETIPRRILRDPDLATARARLTGQCARALAAVHSVDPDAVAGLPRRDPLGDPLPFLDAVGVARPALELAARRLWSARPPAGRTVLVHGDFRSGNLLVGPDGLRAVLDWERPHAGEAAEDLGWLCAPAWRFGGTGVVGGFGDLPDLLAAYAAAGGDPPDEAAVTWWQGYATLKWAVICALQAAAHLSGATRSVELAAIGRRVCESEWDLLALLGVPDPGPGPDPGPVPVTDPFGRPSAAELVEAVAGYLEARVADGPGGADRFEARVARNALGMVGRELALGPAVAAAHRARLDDLGVADDAALVALVRTGALDDRWDEVAPLLAASARDQLLVANPRYLDPVRA